jgi:hypothetical protein
LWLILNFLFFFCFVVVVVAGLLCDEQKEITLLVLLAPHLPLFFTLHHSTLLVMEKKNELVSTLQSLLSSHEESDVFSASEDFSSKITEILSELTSKAKKEEPKLDVTVLCEFMTPAENVLLWDLLLLYTNSLINTLTDEEEDNEGKSEGEEEADEEAEANNKTIIVTMLRKVASVLSQYFELSTLTPRPNSFFLTIQSLHNILVPLDEDIAGE